MHLHCSRDILAQFFYLHSVLVQKFQLDLNIRAELFKLCLLVVEAGQGLCLLQLVHLSVESVGFILVPAALCKWWELI